MGMRRLCSAMAIITVVTLVALMSVSLAGCPGEEPPEMDYEDPLPPPGDPEPEEAEPVNENNAGENEAAAEEENAKTMVTIATRHGEMVAEIYDETMPITAGSFLLLIDDGFYDGLTFHRVVPEFVIQGGDPAGDGTGGPGFTIPMEKPGEVPHERGVLSMARSQHIDSAGSQFFVCLSDNESVRALDSLGGGYAAFGKVVEGMEIADQVVVGDEIEKITITSESEHADAAREAAEAARVRM